MDRNSKEFKELQAKWYKKLKDSGFEDAEQDEHNLHWWASSRQSKSRHASQYYRLAGHFLYDHKFKSAEEKLIWKLHSDGISIRDIIQKLKEKYPETPAYKNKVHEVIQRLAKAMKEKYRDSE